MNINFEFCTKREDGSTKRRRRMLCDFVLQQWRDYDQEGSEAEKKKAHVKGGKDCHVLMGLEFCMKKRPHRQIRGINRERRCGQFGELACFFCKLYFVRGSRGWLIREKEGAELVTLRGRKGQPI
ncbi:hypothetical protein KP509_27G018000 [Ceratopteris richardii]|uniref:Uncharacterized protein n=1 Tax=Ceratopteris richardii TaxID=49495 RepID=A0A8T2RFS7_CERRI|nr:hypothetical protein KP509_27G018000 [Ceratopteris richardii]